MNRAANLVKEHAAGKFISKVETNEDSIVFAGVSHTEFVSLQGKATMCTYHPLHIFTGE